MNNIANILNIKNLKAGYNGKPVLHGLDLILQKGEVCCIIGEEGAGKSTILKAITQQLISDGEISYNGITLRTVPTSKMTQFKIDFVTQGGNILNGFSVEEHICLALSDRSESEKSIIWKEIEQTFPKMIKAKKQIAGTLSGGERMILSISCLLATDSDFLVLDEPTAGLAPETCKEIGDIILRMKNERGKTILLLEHNYEFAFEISDTVAILKNGKLSNKFLPIDFKQNDFIDSNLFN